MLLAWGYTPPDVPVLTRGFAFELCSPVHIHSRPGCSHTFCCSTHWGCCTTFHSACTHLAVVQLEIIYIAEDYRWQSDQAQVAELTGSHLVHVKVPGIELMTSSSQDSYSEAWSFQTVLLTLGFRLEAYHRCLAVLVRQPHHGHLQVLLCQCCSHLPSLGFIYLYKMRFHLRIPVFKTIFCLSVTGRPH